MTMRSVSCSALMMTHSTEIVKLLDLQFELCMAHLTIELEIESPTPFAMNNSRLKDPTNKWIAIYTAGAKKGIGSLRSTWLFHVSH